jgi:hypothetical protein
MLLLSYLFQGDSKNDAWIFSLAILLSSTLVYNSRGTIDNQAVENLQYPLNQYLFPHGKPPLFPLLLTLTGVHITWVGDISPNRAISWNSLSY